MTYCFEKKKKQNCQWWISIKEPNIWLGPTFFRVKVRSVRHSLHIFKTDYDSIPTTQAFPFQDGGVRSLLWLPEMNEDPHVCKYGRHFLYNFI